MKRYIPIAAALAVAVLLGAAIMASGEALSFSVPGTGDSVVERGPAGQVEPQDFDGAGSQYYYFGPDFMCLIYLDSTVDCFGSNRDNVVSGAPTGTGFTNIDGGDTYACAFHQATRFVHCWGSINLRPRTTQPTATPEPTSTPEPTATTLVPGVTPEPTSTVEPIIRTACHIPRSGSATYPLTLTGTWVDACTLDDGTPFIVDAWRQQGTGSVTITASSPGDPNLFLFEVDESIPVGNEGWTTLLAYNDDIDTDGGNYDAQIVHKLEDGKHYWVSVSPYVSSTRGDFTLIYTSTNSGLGWAAGYDPDGGLPDLSHMEAIMERARE